MSTFAISFPTLAMDPDAIRLLIFANILYNILKYCSSPKNFQRILTICVCLAEGPDHTRLITGSSQCSYTEARVQTLNLVAERHPNMRGLATEGLSSSRYDDDDDDYDEDDESYRDEETRNRKPSKSKSLTSNTISKNCPKLPKVTPPRAMPGRSCKVQLQILSSEFAISPPEPVSPPAVVSSERKSLIQSYFDDSLISSSLKLFRTTDSDDILDVGICNNEVVNMERDVLADDVHVVTNGPATDTISTRQQLLRPSRFNRHMNYNSEYSGNRTLSTTLSSNQALTHTEGSINFNGLFNASLTDSVLETMLMDESAVYRDRDREDGSVSNSDAFIHMNMQELSNRLDKIAVVNRNRLPSTLGKLLPANLVEKCLQYNPKVINGVESGSNDSAQLRAESSCTQASNILSIELGLNNYGHRICVCVIPK